MKIDKLSNHKCFDESSKMNLNRYIDNGETLAYVSDELFYKERLDQFRWFYEDNTLSRLVNNRQLVASSCPYMMINYYKMSDIINYDKFITLKNHDEIFCNKNELIRVHNDGKISLRSPTDGQWIIFDNRDIYYSFIDAYGKGLSEDAYIEVSADDDLLISYT